MTMRGLGIQSLALFALASSFACADEWETWEHCRLATFEYHDGDSFHVVKDGEDKIFRLYAVDTAETSDEFPERVQEQQDFFEATSEEIVAAGKEATEFTRNLLQKPFTVETKWVDARGASNARRFFAKITLSDGSDLGVRLLEAGLARSYGMREGLPASYLARLDRAQADARRSRIGLWGRNGTAMPGDEDERKVEGTETPENADLLGTQSVFDRLQQEAAAGTE